MCRNSESLQMCEMRYEREECRQKSGEWTVERESYVSYTSSKCSVATNEFLLKDEKE